MLRCFYTTLVILIACGWLSADETVPLYPIPDAAEATVLEVAPDNPILAQARPMDPDNPEGWHIVEWSGTYTGYVPADELDKDMEVRPGVMVYAEPDEVAIALGPIGESDEVETVTTGDWYEVAVTTQRPLYFQPPPPMRPAQVRAMPPPETEVEPPPETEVEPPPEAVREREPAIGGRAITPHRGPVTPAPGVHGHFEGYLEQSRPRIGFVRHPYRYQLTAADGRRMAYIDTSGLVLPGPLDRYVDSWVVVFGNAEKIQRGRNIVIRVLQVRAK